MSTRRLSFATTSADGEKKVFSYPYIKSAATTAQVRAIATALTTNGSIFATPPTSVRSAYITTTDITSIDIS